MKNLNGNSFLKDAVARKIFTDIELKDYLISVICAAFKFDPKYIQDIELVQTDVSDNINLKNVELDSCFENENGVYNIEINYTKYNTLKVKNTIYLCHLLIRQTRPGQDYDNVKRIYQLNINNFDIFGKNRLLYTSKIMETELHLVRDDLFVIADVNVDYLSKMDYNIIRKEKENSLEKLLYIFSCNDFNKLDQIYLNDEIMKKVVKKLDSLTEAFDNNLYYNREDLLNRGAYSEGKAEGIAEGKVEGIAEGKEETKLKILKNMLKN